MANVAISAQVVSNLVFYCWFRVATSPSNWNSHCQRVPQTGTITLSVCLRAFATGKQLRPHRARICTILDTSGFKRADLLNSREGGDRCIPVAVLPNLISVVFGTYWKPILESRLSAVSFGILVVAETAVDYKYLYEERPKQWRVLIEMICHTRPVTPREGQEKQGPRQDRRAQSPRPRSLYQLWATPLPDRR